MTFTEDAWAFTSALRASIDDLPFVQALADGSLDRAVFTRYLTQDALYLAEYGRVLAAAASQSTDPDELIFWASAAQGALVVERALHARHVDDVGEATMTPVTTAYTSYLWSLVAQGCYPALAAGLLPCFWIYDDVGTRLVGEAGDLADHPYGDWIATYGDPDFAESTRQARAIVDALATASAPSLTERMHHAFLTSCRFEWMFWDAPLQLDSWPDPAPTSSQETESTRFNSAER
ncbi:thiaminase II [soil metagenome]